MTRKATLAVLATLALVLAAGSALAETPAQLAKRVQAVNQKINSLSANYTRVSRFVAVGPTSGRQVKAEGAMLWARPWNLRLEQDEPRAQLVAANAQTVWWVRAKRKQADLYPTEHFTSGLKPLMEALGGLASLAETFDVAGPTAEEARAIDGALTLALIPKVKRADLSRLVVWFDQTSLLIRGFRMITLVGDVTEYRLRGLKVNPPVPPGSFTFRPPADYKVRDHRPLDQPR